MKSTIKSLRLAFALGLILGFMLLSATAAYGQTAGLQMTKSASSDSAQPGDTLTYTILIYNTGAESVSGFEVIDVMPATLSYVAGSATGMATFNTTRNSLHWTMGTLASHASVSLYFRAVISPTATEYSTIRNVALIPGGTGLTSSAVTVIIPHPPHLEIIKRVDSALAFPRSTLTYYLTVTNFGLGAAHGITVVDTVPAHTAYLTGDGTYTPDTRMVSWSLADLEPGQTSHLNFSVIIDNDAPAESEIRNAALITTPDTTRSDTTTTIVRPFPPDIQITKTVNLATAFAGDTLTYTLVLTNNGLGSANQVAVIDTIPGMTSYISGSATADGQFDATARTIAWTIPTLEPEGTAELIFKAAINSETPARTEIINSAYVTSPDTRHSNNVTTTVIARPPHLAIVKTVSSTMARPGDTLTYTLEVSNSGLGDAGQVAVIDTVPAYSSYLSGSITAQGEYVSAGRLLVWNIPEITSGNSVTLSFKTVVDVDIMREISVRNFAFITTPDTTYSDTTTTVVTPFPPELEISKSVNASEAYRGDTLTYTLTVNNFGHGPATNVTINDPLPSYTSYVSSSASHNGQYDSDNRLLTWTLSEVAPLNSTALSFQVTITSDAQYGPSIRNFALITTPDTSISDTTTTIIKQRSSALSITKSANLYAAYTGDTLVYTIRVSNNGNVTVQPVIVADTVPTHTTYIVNSASSNGQYDSEARRVDWNIAALAPTQSISLSFKAIIDSAALAYDSVWNMAQILSPDTIRSEKIITIIKQKLPELTITKAVDASSAITGDTLTYTLTVANRGQAAAQNVIVEDTIPLLAEYVAASATGDGQYNADRRVLRWTLGVFAPLTKVPLRFKVVAGSDIPDSTLLKNFAIISSPGTIVSDTVLTLIRRYQPSLTITKTVDSVEASPRSTLVYTLHLSNSGNRTVSGISIVDTVPSLAIYVAGSASANGHYDSESNRVNWETLSLDPGKSLNLSFRVSISRDATDGTIIANQAVIDLPVSRTSNTVKTTVRIHSGADDLVVHKTVNKTNAASGDALHYAINISNTGGDDAASVVLTDTIPTHTHYVAGSGGNGTYSESNNTIVWNLGTVVGHSGTSVEFDVTIDWETPAQTIIQNQANITAPIIIKGNIVSTTVLGQPQLRVTKSAGVPSGSAGSLIPYTVTVTNISDAPAEDVVLVDSLPMGLFYVTGSTVISGKSASDPTGNNPYYWQLGHLGPDSSTTIKYTAIVGTAAASGIQENFAWAESGTGASKLKSSIASARVSIISSTLTGSIRGRVIVDCDGDGQPDTDSIPSRTNLYLDDGSMSQVNYRGMFYFSTVRAGEHTVTLDTRGLNGYVFPAGSSASVFAYVHEAGETYITFRLCPEQPVVIAQKWATLVPKVKVTKTATLDDKNRTDTAGVTINYQVTVQSNGGIDPTTVRVIDSFPEETRLVIQENQTVTPSLTNHTLTYQVAVDRQPLAQSVYYSLKDLVPGMRRFLVNKIHLEGTPSIVSEKSTPIISAPTEVSVGPFRRTPPKDIQFDLIGAHFETSKADLRPDAVPILQKLADTLKEYDGADLKAEGHADYRRIHTKEFPSNWELSTARAKSVVDWLARNGGVDISRMSYEGFAATRPRDTGRTPEALQKNRRVELFVKARKDSRVDLSALTTDRWSASTTLELAPISWDTLMAPTASVEPGLNDIWEIRIVIESKGPGKADEIILSDLMPTGAEYIEGSAALDGQPAQLEIVAGDKIRIQLSSLTKCQKTELKYRIRATSSQAPSGSVKSTLEMQTSAKKKVTIYSNPVLFQ